ncbi:hypothetical protein IWQ61_004145 [Dispira simplex]|nr:hypothetical protein IWQ61_004145 [Dispira simplex]
MKPVPVSILMFTILSLLQSSMSAPRPTEGDGAPALSGVLRELAESILSGGGGGSTNSPANEPAEVPLVTAGQVPPISWEQQQAPGAYQSNYNSNSADLQQLTDQIKKLTNTLNGISPPSEATPPSESTAHANSGGLV